MKKEQGMRQIVTDLMYEAIEKRIAGDLTLDVTDIVSSSDNMDITEDVPVVTAGAETKSVITERLQACKLHFYVFQYICLQVLI